MACARSSREFDGISLGDRDGTRSLYSLRIVSSLMLGWLGMSGILASGSAQLVGKSIFASLEVSGAMSPMRIGM